MQKLGCHRGGEFTPVGDIILQSNMSKGGNLLWGGHFLHDSPKGAFACTLTQSR